MKRVFLSLVMCVTMTLSMVACAPQNDNPGSSLTPSEHKSKLEDIALEFIDSFNINDTEEIVSVLYDLMEYLEDGEFPEYYSDMMMNIANGAQNMSTANFMAFATRATEDFVIDINDPDFNPYGGHSYTYDDGEWVENEINDKSIKLIWDNSEAKLAWDDSKKFEYEFDDINYIAYVPKTITFTLKIAGSEHINIIVKPNITDVQTLAPSVEAKLNGGYVLSASNNVNNKGVEAHSSIKKNGKALLSSTAVVAINDITDIDHWLDEYYCDFCEENHYDIDPSEYIAYNTKTGAVQVDILNLSIIAEGDFKGMYEQYEELEEEDDDNNSKDFCNKVCKLINDKVKAAIVYNDTKEKIADIIMQVASYQDYYGTEYYFEPILLFSDDSKYAFEDYFTERAFGDLLDKIDELAADVKDLIGGE